MGIIEKLQEENQELKQTLSKIQEELTLIRFSLRYIGWVHWQDAARISGITTHATLKKKGQNGELTTRIKPGTTSVLEVNIQSICEYLHKKGFTVEAIGARVSG